MTQPRIFVNNISFHLPTGQTIFTDLTLAFSQYKTGLVGRNGVGKSTLLKLILGEFSPTIGSIQTEGKFGFVPQNPVLLEHTTIARFLFRNVAALKMVKDLSGGEKLRTLLACVLMSNHPPQLLILDEPTNHLDINSIQSIESALNYYQGALIVISHDKKFLENVGIKKIISAPFTE